MSNEPDPADFFTHALKGKLPGMVSQAQYNAFMASFDALAFTFNAICSGNKTQEEAGLKALDQSLDVGRKATEITNKLRDVPEAATSAASEEFKKPPSEFGEYDVQKRLLFELESVSDSDALKAWYAKSKEDRNHVKTQSLRNTLFDAIRAKSSVFQDEEAKKTGPAGKDI